MKFEQATTYRISSYKTRGYYFFPVPSIAGIIRMRVLFEGWYYYQNFIDLDNKPRNPDIFICDMRHNNQLISQRMHKKCTQVSAQKTNISIDNLIFFMRYVLTFIIEPVVRDQIIISFDLKISPRGLFEGGYY